MTKSKHTDPTDATDERENQAWPENLRDAPTGVLFGVAADVLESLRVSLLELLERMNAGPERSIIRTTVDPLIVELRERERAQSPQRGRGDA